MVAGFVLFCFVLFVLFCFFFVLFCFVFYFFCFLLFFVLFVLFLFCFFVFCFVLFYFVCFVWWNYMGMSRVFNEIVFDRLSSVQLVESLGLIRLIIAISP